MSLIGALSQHRVESRIIFAELKTDKGVLSKIQDYVIGQMRLRHVDVRVLYGLKQGKEFLAEIGREAQ